MTVLCVAAAAGSAQVHAVESGYGLNVGLGHSDNVGRTADAPIDETIAVAGADLLLSHTSTRLNAEFSGTGQYREYLDDTFDSEVVGSAVGQATLDIIRERFTWLVEDTFGQATVDPLSPVSPGNRENVNYLTTGPDFTLPLGSRTNLLLLGRYSDIHYETSQLGNERLLARAALLRQLSEASTASINVMTEETEFQDAQDVPDFERREAYLNYEMTGARTTLGFDVGLTEVEVKNAEVPGAGPDQSSDGLLLRARISRVVSPSLTVGLDAGREFSDAGNIFRQLQNEESLNGNLQTQPVQDQATPFTNTYGTLSWDFQRNRTTLYARASYFDEAYEGAAELADRQRMEGQLGMRRSLSTSTTMRFQGTYSRQDYEHIDREFSDLTATAIFDWRIGRVTSLSFQYMHFERGDDVQGDVSENQFWVRLGIFGGNRQQTDMPAMGGGY